MNEYRVGSLFAGVGGICLGFKNARVGSSCYKLSWANEEDEFACITYRGNFTHPLFEGDIRKVLHPDLIDKEIEEARVTYGEVSDEINFRTLSRLERYRDVEFGRYTGLHDQILAEPIDVLTGGFPCQAFSIAGERKGFRDVRGNLFLSIIDFIQQIGERFYKPRVIFLENVKNLKFHDNGRTYKVIRAKLEDCGYHVYDKILNTMYYSDLPQNRDRMYIFGFLDSVDGDKFNNFLTERVWDYRRVKMPSDRVVDIKRVIDYNLTLETGEKYYYTREKYPNYFMTLEEFRGSNKEECINLDKQIDEMYKFYQFRRCMYVRKNMSGVCPTLLASMGTGGHNVPLIRVRDGVRKLTPSEVFRLQGFPVGEGYTLPTEYNGVAYPDRHLYKQAGNAVSVPIITMFAEEILKVLG